MSIGDFSYGRMKEDTQMMICDIHCHILPGLDDGATDMEETAAALEEAVRQQVGCMIATPHFHPGRYRTDAEKVLRALEKVQDECAARGLDITLYPGHECYYYSGLVQELERGNVLTLAYSRYVLVEFEPDCPYPRLERGLRDLQNNGYAPVLAHFERYECLRREENLRQLKQRGFLMQMNFDTLLAKEHLFRRYPWRRLVQQGAVDFLASDCHGTHYRPLHALQVQECLDSFAGASCKEKLFRTNVLRILENQ